MKIKTIAPQRKKMGRPPCEHPKNSQVTLRINDKVKDLAKEHYNFADEVQNFFLAKLIKDKHITKQKRKNARSAIRKRKNNG